MGLRCYDRDVAVASFRRFFRSGVSFAARYCGVFPPAHAADGPLPLAARDTGRAVSQENVELVRRLLTLWNRASAVGVEAAERSVALRELADLAGEFFDPDIEWHDQSELPGATIHHGIEGVGRHLAAAQDALDYEHTDLVELLDADPRVLAAYLASSWPIERHPGRARRLPRLHLPRRENRVRRDLREQERGPRSRGAAGVGDVAGECRACPLDLRGLGAR